ncbi:hypothetical protein, partial [Peijinzhouia sedimentorum]
WRISAFKFFFFLNRGGHGDLRKARGGFILSAFISVICGRKLPADGADLRRKNHSSDILCFFTCASLWLNPSIIKIDEVCPKTFLSLVLSKKFP